MRSHYLVHSSKTPALTTSSAARRMPYFQQLDALWPTVARTCRQGVTKAKVNTLTSRPGSMKIEKSCVPVWQALAYLIQNCRMCCMHHSSQISSHRHTLSGHMIPGRWDSLIGKIASCLKHPNCENHARKMRTFFTRRLEPKTRSSYHIKWSNAK